MESGAIVTPEQIWVCVYGVIPEQICMCVYGVTQWHLRMLQWRVYIIGEVNRPSSPLLPFQGPVWPSDSLLGSI